MEFLTWRCWIGFWVMIILFGVVALEGCFLIKYFTRFTEDIFELLISAIFIYEPIALLIKVRIMGTREFMVGKCTRVGKAEDRVGNIRNPLNYSRIIH